MSVPFSLLVVDPTEFTNQLAKEDFWDLLDEEVIVQEPLICDEVDFQNYIVECFNSFKGDLSNLNNESLSAIINTLFYNWRGDEGIKTIEQEFPVEGLELSISPTRCKELASAFSRLDYSEIEAKYKNTEVYPLEFQDFKEYLFGWSEAILKAVQNQKFLITVVAV